MGGSINGGSRQWMVHFMENPSKMNDLGGSPMTMETSKSGCDHQKIKFRQGFDHLKSGIKQ